MPSLDHLIYGVPVLPDMVEELAERLGVRADSGGQHLGLGTHNALLALGDDCYLEIVAPDPRQNPEIGTLPLGLDELERPRLVGWVARCDGIGSHVARARKLGCDVGEPLAGGRKTQAGGFLDWWATTESICDGVVPFLIEWGGQHPARTAPRGLDLLSFHLEHPAPDSVQPWLAALGLRVEVIRASSPALVAKIAGPHGTVELR
jgi:hypothetical protein